jgi:hypothetical protein
MIEGVLLYSHHSSFRHKEFPLLSSIISQKRRMAVFEEPEMHPPVKLRGFTHSAATYFSPFISEVFRFIVP